METWKWSTRRDGWNGSKRTTHFHTTCDWLWLLYSVVDCTHQGPSSRLRLDFLTTNIIRYTRFVGFYLWNIFVSWGVFFFSLTGSSGDRRRSSLVSLENERHTFHRLYGTFAMETFPFVLVFCVRIYRRRLGKVNSRHKFRHKVAVVWKTLLISFPVCFFVSVCGLDSTSTLHCGSTSIGLLSDDFPHRSDGQKTSGPLL